VQPLAPGDEVQHLAQQAGAAAAAVVGDGAQGAGEGAGERAADEGGAGERGRPEAAHDPGGGEGAEGHPRVQEGRRGDDDARAGGDGGPEVKRARVRNRHGPALARDGRRGGRAQAARKAGLFPVARVEQRALEGRRVGDRARGGRRAVGRRVGRGGDAGDRAFADRRDAAGDRAKAGA